MRSLALPRDVFYLAARSAAMGSSSLVPSLFFALPRDVFYLAARSAAMGSSSLVPRPLSEKSRRGLATVPYNGLSRAVCTVRANQIAEFSYVTLIAS